MKAMRDSELLERLRDLGVRSANLAADRIEALTAERDAVKEAYDDIEQYARRHCAEVEALTAELDALKAQNEYQEEMIRQADVRGDYWRASAENAEADADATAADNARLRAELTKAADSLDWADAHLEDAGVVSANVRYGARDARAALNHGKETK
jgi:chromosome segregation ATPase